MLSSISPTALTKLLKSQWECVTKQTWLLQLYISAWRIYSPYSLQVVGLLENFQGRERSHLYHVYWHWCGHTTSIVAAVQQDVHGPEDPAFLSPGFEPSIQFDAGIIVLCLLPLCAWYASALQVLVIDNHDLTRQDGRRCQEHPDLCIPKYSCGDGIVAFPKMY